MRLLEGTEVIESYAELHLFCGRACRLTQHHDEAATHFRTALESSSGLRSNETRGYAFLELTDSLIETGDRESAQEAANEALALAKSGSLLESQAKAKLLRFEKGDHSQKLSQMEANARSKNWLSHANDISLGLYYNEKDTLKKWELLEIVLKTTEQGWNRHRAIIEKAILAIRMNEIERLSSRDRSTLNKTYSYCHSQRLGLFDRCHEALWGILERENNRDALYRLFKHSSFIWRIRGDEKTEIMYFERLKNFNDKQSGISSGILVEFQYFTKRAAILLLRLSGMSSR
jgi:hypothetical protein